MLGLRVKRLKMWVRVKVKIWVRGWVLGVRVKRLKIWVRVKVRIRVRVSVES